MVPLIRIVARGWRLTSKAYDARSPNSLVLRCAKRSNQVRPRRYPATRDSDDAGLIVMGTRGHQPQQNFLGSGSLEVVTRATQPVLLVPPQVWQQP
jgi:hypothetical protein